MTRSFLEVLSPDGFASQFNAVSTPDPPGRPDMADVIHHDNEGIEDINDSVLEAEYSGVLSRLVYPLPLKPIE